MGGGDIDVKASLLAEYIKDGHCKHLYTFFGKHVTGPLMCRCGGADEHNHFDIGSLDESEKSKSLHPFVDFPKSAALNIKKDGILKSVLRDRYYGRDADNHLSSDADPQIIVKIQFSCTVKIKSISVEAKDEQSSPLKMKAFVNMTDVDFTNIEEKPATQEWNLVAESIQGITKEIIKYPTKARALTATNGQDLQSALDWLDEHQDDQIPSHKIGDEAAEEPTEADDHAPKSLKCNECGKLFSSVEFAQLHAAKSGHQDFSESEAVHGSTELTAEQKAQKLEELRAKLSEKRKLEAAQKELESHQAELLRRKGGQLASEARREAADREIRKAAEDLRRGREEERQIRARIRAEMEAERKARQQPNLVSQEATIHSEPPKMESQSATVVRIQVRLPDGSQIRETFQPDDKLGDLIDKIAEKLSVTPQSTLTIPFPHRKIDLKTENAKTFMELGLCPSASLIFQP